MLIDERTLQPGLFRLPDDPVGPRVLIPGFRAATSVRGAFGWFSAGWIARLAPGLAEYLSRSDTAPIDFTVSPMIFSAERSAIEDGSRMSPDEAAQRVADVFVAGRADASALGRHALDCLAWMIATGRLRLRIAVPTAVSNYHPKIWLFDDGVNQVLARGSGNATGRGVSEGVEHIDVDVSWLEHSRGRVLAGISMLTDWERGLSRGLECVLDLPDALEQDIIKTAPDVAPSERDFANAARDDMEPSWATDPTELLRASLNMSADQLLMTFQSRFGPSEWLKPYTDETIARLAQEGVRRIAVLTPGFAADCLETLEEIAQENAEIFHQNGGEAFTFIPCLNDSAGGMAVIRQIVLRELQGWV